MKDKIVLRFYKSTKLKIKPIIELISEKCVISLTLPWTGAQDTIVMKRLPCKTILCLFSLYFFLKVLVTDYKFHGASQNGQG